MGDKKLSKDDKDYARLHNGMNPNRVMPGSYKEGKLQSIKTTIKFLTGK
jgi:hypothetical protein